MKPVMEEIWRALGTSGMRIFSPSSPARKMDALDESTPSLANEIGEMAEETKPPPPPPPSPPPPLLPSPKSKVRTVEEAGDSGDEGEGVGTNVSTRGPLTGAGLAIAAGCCVVREDVGVWGADDDDEDIPIARAATAIDPAPCTYGCKGPPAPA